MIAPAGRRPALRFRELVIPVRVGSLRSPHLSDGSLLTRRGGLPHLQVPCPFASIPIASGAISPPLRAA